MGRKPVGPIALQTQIAIRLTAEERELLDKLVAKRAARLGPEGGDVTMGSVIRALIRNAAIEEGVK